MSTILTYFATWKDARGRFVACSPGRLASSAKAARARPLFYSRVA